MAISSEVLRIREILGQADLRVPPYQRGFAWEDKEINALMKDLSEAFELGATYFLGAFVVIQQRGGAKAPADVVDGQQRLSTLTIMLAVLRDLTSSSDEAALLHQMIGSEGAMGGRFGDRHRWRLTLNTQDAPFFRAHVQTRNATRRIEEMDDLIRTSRSESQVRLLKAVRLIHDEFLDFSDDERSRFARWLLDEISIVKVRVTEHNIGYKVFLVLNHRGKPLSDHDILKSALFERAGFLPEEAMQHAVRWNAYAMQLGSEDFEGMLKQIRFLYDRNMRGEFIDGLMHSIILRMPVGAFINDMLPRFVEAFDCVCNANFARIDLAPEARRSLAFLRIIHHEGWRAPAIKYLVEHMDDRDGATRFFAALERLAFMLQYCVRDRDFRGRRYRRLLDFMDGPGPDDIAGSPLDLTADERKSVLDRLRGRFSNFKQRRALLMRISASVPGGEALPPDADATVEHILPRTPSKGSDWYEEWSRARDIEDLTECIGNFTLLRHAENQAADRKAFVQKLNSYFRDGRASFAISEDLKGRTKWTPDDVRARRDLLISYLQKEWDL